MSAVAKPGTNVGRTTRSDCIAGFLNGYPSCEAAPQCGQAGLPIEHMKVEDAGIAVLARKLEL